MPGIKGVTLHSYRYAWAERAKVCGYPERFAQEALGHNSKAVHRAYAKRALINGGHADQVLTAGDLQLNRVCRAGLADHQLDDLVRRIFANTSPRIVRGARPGIKSVINHAGTRLKPASNQRWSDGKLVAEHALMRDDRGRINLHVVGDATYTFPNSSATLPMI